MLLHHNYSRPFNPIPSYLNPRYVPRIYFLNIYINIKFPFTYRFPKPADLLDSFLPKSYINLLFPQPMSIGGRGLFPWEVKRLGRESSHSPPTSAEVKIAWRYTSTPQIRFHSVVLVEHRDDFTFAI
jgi:hypothetical protein